MHRFDVEGSAFLGRDPALTHCGLGLLPCCSAWGADVGDLLRRAGLWLVATCMALVFALGCHAPHPAPPAAEDPLAWPGVGLSRLGDAAEDSGVPLVRESGALLSRIGGLVQAPALVVEGLVSARPLDGPRMIVQGVGESATAAINLPFCWMIGGDVDLGRDEADVNDALAYLEANAPVFPKGTRVSASGKNLVWEVPGEGEVLQRAEVGINFGVLLSISGTRYTAQEHSWGFVVPSRKRWDEMTRRQRAATIVHELCHQEEQIRKGFLGWSAIYWIAYDVSYFIQGYSDHWAEYGSWGAHRVEQGLAGWEPRNADAE